MSELAASGLQRADGGTSRSLLAARCSLIVAVAIAQAFIAYRYFGFLTGDEVEILDEAFHRALHHPFTPWDVRNLFVADVIVAPFVWLASKLGVNAIEFASLPFIALTAITIELVRRLALKWSEGDERAATMAMLFFALHWIPLGFGATTYPRTLATCCVVAAALIVDRLPITAGGLIALAFTDRFSEGVYLVVFLCGGGRPRPLSGGTAGEDARHHIGHGARFLAGFALVACVTVGLYDLYTYGAPFHSLIGFAKVTLLAPDFASRVKYQSPLWYLANILRWLAPTMLPLLWIARRRAHWLFIVTPLVALSIVRHKELRYLQTMIPFIAIAAAIGASMLWRERRALAIALVAMSIVWNLAGIRFVTKKTMPAVLAARAIASDSTIHRIAVSQLWAYGDRLYFTPRLDIVDVGEPPAAIPSDIDAIALWETDLDVAQIPPGFTKWRTFTDGDAKPVVVFRRSTLHANHTRRSLRHGSGSLADVGSALGTQRHAAAQRTGADRRRDDAQSTVPRLRGVVRSAHEALHVRWPHACAARRARRGAAA